MKRIFKTPTPNTYFEGTFQLRDNSTNNWGHPIDFPTVFTAFGKGIKSGNWQSCTAINTPKYVIDNYFSGEKGQLNHFWDAVFALENLSYDDVNNDKNKVLELINEANNRLLNLSELK